MLSEVKRLVQRERMLPPGAPVHVAVSGGLDSMVLLHALRALGHACKVIHVDHGLRGPESDADRAFVVDYCAQHSIPCRTVRVDVRSHTDNTAASTQMAARELRYAEFEKVFAQEPLPIALGHHQDDAIETLFIHLLRGTGMHGWSSIPPVAGCYVRPLLTVGRAAIMAYAIEHGIPFREDSSNADSHYLRNRVRQELLPLLEDLRPGARKSIGRSVEALRDLREVADRAIQNEFDGWMPDEGASACWPFAQLDALHSHRIVLNLLLRPLGFHPDALDRIQTAITARSTGALFHASDWCVCVDRQGVILQRVEEQLPVFIIDPETASSPGTAFQWSFGTDPDAIPDSKNDVLLDADALSFPLELRPWRAGDRMRPIGLKGSKLISDILTNGKVAASDKAGCYVLKSGDDVVWLVGHRIGEGFQASPATIRTFRVRCSG
jgi:tRNA(Ile)-lysidine synthase